MATVEADAAASVFAVADQKDADGFASAFAEDAVLRFGNAEPLVGREQIRQAMNDLFSAIAGIHHEIVNEWRVDDTVIVEVSVTYDRLDGKSVTVPATSIWRVTDGEIADKRICIDQAPVWSDN